MSRVSACLKMKDLTAQTGVSREAIHFYLREGLLPEPARPKPNVAHYTHEHVVRINTIKQLQQQRSLSLDTIKTMLQEFDYDALSASDDLAMFELSVHSHVNGSLPARDQDLHVVAAKAGLCVQSIQQLHDLGVISITQSAEGARVDFRDADIVEQWGQLLNRGYQGKSGYDAQYLKRFSDAINTLAEFEVEIFLNAFTGTLSEDTATMAAEGINLSNEILTRLHTQALMRFLRRRVENID